MDHAKHKTLACGIEMGCVPLPDRHVVSLEFRFLSGTTSERPEHLGIARIVHETIDLGTERRDGRALSDAFDEIGAGRGGWVGREASAFQCLVLPEFLGRAIGLHAEFLRTPTFPDDKVTVAVDLAKQEWNALQDDAHELADKMLGQHAYGPLLGRHALGEPETLNRITRELVVSHWSSQYGNGRLQVSAAGAVEASRLEALLNEHFSGFGAMAPAGRSTYPIAFSEGTTHYQKELEQQQIGIGYRGVAIPTEEYPTQRVMLAILSGGMSSRLFTEVREKQGLVYWVSAWGEYPRGHGMIFLGASTTPDRCTKTYATLLGEVERLGEDLTQDELERAITGITAKVETQGDETRSYCRQLADDLFHHGHPVPREEKLARIRAVTIDDIKSYLGAHPREALCVVTLGPRAMEGATQRELSTATPGATA